MAPPDYEAKWRERREAEGVGRIADTGAEHAVGTEQQDLADRSLFIGGHGSTLSFVGLKSAFLVPASGASAEG
jgi:hypothetical protein